MVHEHHARPLHWDLRLERDGVLVSGRCRRGYRPTREPPGGPYRGPPARVHRLPRRDPRRPVRGGHDEDLGQRDLRTRSCRDGEVIAMFHGERLRGRYALFRTRGQNWMIHRMDPPEDPGREPLPERVLPMLATSGRRCRARGRLRVRGQVGRRARDRLRRRDGSGWSRATATTSPRATRSCAARARARLAPGHPRRRGRRLRRGRQPVASGPCSTVCTWPTSARCAAREKKEPVDLPGLRRPPPRRPLAVRRALRRPPRRARSSSS